ncbi:cytochrome P450 [Backusella circina FSU 941]|nr:cytochrome P450 [Backusella circina FSU 941]
MNTHFTFQNMSLISENKNSALSLIGAVSALSLIYTAYRSMYPKVGPTEIPIPTPCYPYIGNMASIGELPGKKIAEWHAKYGPIIRVRMGVQTWIMIGDPALAHELFVSNGIESAGRLYTTYGSKYYSAGQRGIAFAEPGSAWKKARGVVLNSLGQKAVENYSELIGSKANEMVESLIRETKANGSVNPSETLEFYSLSIISKIALGKKFESLDDPNFKKTRFIMAKSTKLCGFEYDLPNFLPIFRPLFYYLGVEKKMKEFIENERDVVFGKYITETRDNKLDNIITALVNDSDNFDEDDILAIITDMVIGGSDTVAITLSWAVSILCNYPDVQKKMQDEIDIFVQKNGSLPTFSDRSELPYCNSVMKECMRHKPTTPLGIPHKVTKEIVLRGFTIPKDSIVVSSMDYMHNGAGHYKNEEEFVPERYFHDDKTMSAAANGKFSERDQFNFGWGRRICPGIYLAEAEIFNAYISIFSKSTIEPVYKNGQPVFPDISGARSGGGTTLPLRYNVQFVERS